MSSPKRPLIVLLAASLLLTVSGLGACDLVRPAKLSDQEFWRIVEEFSEPGGEFRSSNAIRTDNLISNETAFEPALGRLQQIKRPGAYLGVGPEQNFTYIAALKPTTAFIVDIRRQSGGAIENLAAAAQQLTGQTNRTPGLASVFTQFTANDPQLVVTIDREQTKALGIPFGDITNTMQILLGSA